MINVIWLKNSKVPGAVIFKYPHSRPDQRKPAGAKVNFYAKDDLIWNWSIMLLLNLLLKNGFLINSEESLAGTKLH